MRVEWGICSSSLNWAEKTSVPSSMVMPMPKILKTRNHSGFHLFRYVDRFRPRGIIRTFVNISCPVVFRADSRLGDVPGALVKAARVPTGRTQMVFVCRSTSTAGSPIPFSSWACRPIPHIHYDLRQAPTLVAVSTAAHAHVNVFL